MKRLATSIALVLVFLLPGCSVRSAQSVSKTDSPVSQCRASGATPIAFTDVELRELNIVEPGTSVITSRDQWCRFFQGGTRHYDTDMPDGVPRKLMDNSKLTSLGWEPAFTLKDGLEDAYQWFVENIDTARI